MHGLVGLNNEVNQSFCPFRTNYALHGLPSQICILQAYLITAPIYHFLDVYVQIIELLLRNLLNCYVDWVYVSDLESFHLYVI